MLFFSVFGWRIFLKCFNLDYVFFKQETHSVVFFKDNEEKIKLK
jgi:hypothetical protein